MSTPRRLLPFLTFALLAVGCDSDKPLAPSVNDVFAPQLATFPPANVAMIGGSALNTNPYCGSSGSFANVMGATYGGCLPVAGHAALAGFNFTPFPPGAVTSGSLASFDIAVLNMASSALACNAANLPTPAKAEIIAVAQAGKKVLIFDSECSVGGTGLDYSWLPYPFATANPGALGARGTLTIVEENTLSTNAPGPYYINAGYLGSSTDAVGDMNVMTTQDPAWCVDMAGTNARGVTGAVHTYANFPTGTDQGLFIYNGLDMDFLSFNRGTGTQELLKIWFNELLQPVAPSGLPCRIPVVNIKLDPPDAINNVGETHTVTATVSDLLSVPQTGVLVTFTVVAGPNVGDVGTATTDALGQASFAYTGDGGLGTDEIQACFTDPQGTQKCSKKVTKTWINVPPVCGPVSVSPMVVQVGNSVTASATFADPTDPFDHTAVWDWGDYATSAGTVDQAAHTVGPDSHTYTSAGSYFVGLEVTDAAGATCTSSIGRVRVWDPDAGFITGGGWINSPAGALMADGSFEGKATFGFVAKYKKGDTVPTGNLEFQLHGADLNFHAERMFWLVVTNDGTMAVFAGEGTINGNVSPSGTPYQFRVRADDLNPDTFHLWLWWIDGGGATQMVYNNGASQPLDNGSIVIHTKGN